MRGEIQNRERARQIRDFRGLQFGTITPTDIDGLLDFRNRLFVYLEAKLSGTELPFGQKLALERQCDNQVKAGVPAAVLILEHDTESTEDIDFAVCSVREYRWKGAWHEPVVPVVCRRAIEILLEKVGIVL